MLHLNGTKDKLIVKSTSDLQLLNKSFTIEAWASVVPNGYFQTILEKRTFPVTGDYWIGIDATDVWRMTVGKYNIDLYSTKTVIPNRQYHVSGVYDHGAGKAYLFIDGILAASGDTLGPKSKVDMYRNGKYVGSHWVVNEPTLINSDAPLYIGASKISGSYDENFDGQLDEIRIWNVARSSDEILSTIDKTLTGNEKGLIAYWNFNQGMGKTVTDVSGNRHTAVVDGSPQWLQSKFNLK